MLSPHNGNPLILGERLYIRNSSYIRGEILVGYVWYGRRWRRWYYGPWGWCPHYPPPPLPPDPESELKILEEYRKDLEEEIRELQAELEKVKARIQELKRTLSRK